MQQGAAMWGMHMRMQNCLSMTSSLCIYPSPSSGSGAVISHIHSGSIHLLPGQERGQESDLLCMFLFGSFVEETLVSTQGEHVVSTQNGQGDGAPFGKPLWVPG